MIKELINETKKLQKELYILEKKLDEKIYTFEKCFELISEKGNKVYMQCFQNITMGASAREEYDEYIVSYIQSALAIRNMMVKGKTELKYTYFFLVIHFFELTFKRLVIFNNESFRDATKFDQHNIVDFYINNKNCFIQLGLKQKYYDVALKNFKDIMKFTNKQNDLAQAFRFPIDKSFKNDIITRKLINLNDDDLKVVARNHFSLLYIGIMIYLLSIKERISKVIEDLNDGLKLCKKGAEELIIRGVLFNEEEKKILNIL